MTILKADTLRSGQHLVGTHVGDKVYTYLCLWTTAKGTTKSRVFNKLILDFISKQKEGWQIETQLVKQIIAKIKIQRAKRSHKNLTTDEFREKVEEDLLRKGLPIDVVAKILLEIE
jgi:hypothetical protein